MIQRDKKYCDGTCEFFPRQEKNGPIDWVGLPDNTMFGFWTLKRPRPNWLWVPSYLVKFCRVMHSVGCMGLTSGLRAKIQCWKIDFLHKSKVAVVPDLRLFAVMQFVTQSHPQDPRALAKCQKIKANSSSLNKNLELKNL